MKKIAWMLSVAALAATTIAQEAKKTYRRDEFRIRDPFVLAENGTYYLYESKPWNGGKGVGVRTSKDLENWSEKSAVMVLPSEVNNTSVWAPEVHKFNGAYWLFTTLTFPADPAHPIKSMEQKGFKGGTLQPRGVWVFRSESPLGPFKPVKNGSVTPADWMCLDGTLWVEDGVPWMVFCHEWCQTGNGRMMAAPLNAGFSGFTADPVELFRAADLPGAGNVTDGPFLFKDEKAGLRMIWSNTLEGSGYCVIQCASKSGKVTGPWTNHTPLFRKDGGHGMLFKTFDGKLMLTIHQPNKSPDERMKLHPVRVSAKGFECEPTATVTADFTRKVRPVKPMHGVGQPPQIGWDYRLFHYLKDAGIPFSRLHDVGGHHGKNAYVDIPNLFRDFDADETDPKNYDFTFTDRLITELVRNDCEPFFRLGITIENLAHIKCYRTFPPKDFAKWARICEHVIRHYTEGWANGFKYKIRYWEIWNEPDNHQNVVQNSMWAGTWQQYMELYDVTAKHLKKCFPDLKIGGYASCGFYAAAKSPAVKAANSSPRTQYFVDCYLEFLKFVKERNSPMDFFSFHSYSNPKEALRQIDWGIKTLHKFGFANVETTLDEWLPDPSHERLGSAAQAADICAEIIGMQQSKLDSAMIYDGRCGIGNYSPLFNPMTYKPHKAYYALKAFNEAYKLKNEVVCNTSHSDVYAIAAGDAAGGVLLVANVSKTKLPFRTEIGGRRIESCLLTDDAHTFEQVPTPQELPPQSFVLLRIR